MFIQDPINNQLRANAFILGDVKGPKLPRKEEELRRDFGKSLSGDTAIESNVVDIRRKVMEVTRLKFLSSLMSVNCGYASQLISYNILVNIDLFSLLLKESVG